MRTRTILVGWLLAGALVCAPAADNPYQAIAARNVFALKDPPPPPSPEDNKPPPPKILLRGLATVLGKKQVLFDVDTPARPPQPAGKTAMILGVGEAQDEIEVLEIVEATGTVKFRNHGVEETKTIENDSAKPVATALPVPGSIPPIVTPRPALPPPGLQTIPTRTPKPAVPPPPGAP